MGKVDKGPGQIRDLEAGGMPAPAARGSAVPAAGVVHVVQEVGRVNKHCVGYLN
jgi:hypothetical protein